MMNGLCICCSPQMASVHRGLLALGQRWGNTPRAARPAATRSASAENVVMSAGDARLTDAAIDAGWK